MATSKLVQNVKRVFNRYDLLYKTQNKMCMIHDNFQPKTTIAFIQLSTDLNLDYEASLLLSQLSDKVSWRFQKINSLNDNDYEINQNFYEKVINNKLISNAASVFNTDPSISVMGLSCTSLSFLFGSKNIEKQLNEGYNCNNNVIFINMADAIIESLNEFKRKLNKNNLNIGLLTPYNNEIHLKNIDFFKLNGYNVINHKNLNIENDIIISSINRESIISNIIEVNNSNIDVLIIGCSAFRSTTPGFIDYCENKIVNKPVITSNQAFIWHMLKSCPYITDNDISNIIGYGQLFSG